MAVSTNTQPISARAEGHSYRANGTDQYISLQQHPLSVRLYVCKAQKIKLSVKGFCTPTLKEIPRILLTSSRLKPTYVLTRADLKAWHCDEQENPFKQKCCVLVRNQRSARTNLTNTVIGGTRK